MTAKSINGELPGEEVKGATTEDQCKEALKPQDLQFISDKKWYLKNYDESKSNRLRFKIKEDVFIQPKEINLVNAETNETYELTKVSDVAYEYDPHLLLPGSYEMYVELTGKCYTKNEENLKSPVVSYNVSYPVLVLWTQDWEGDDVQQKYLDDITRISKQYGVVMTHYWNPRIYLEGGISKQRADYLTKWIKDRRDNYGEEIGLHIHMFNNIVSYLQLTDPKVHWGQRTDGYDRLTGEFSKEDFLKVLNWAEAEFIKHGFEKPTNFRAGGWFTSKNTLAALEQKDYRIESSGREPYKIGVNQKPGYWTLNDLSQPYHPSRYNQSREDIDDEDNFHLWEVPNNAGNTWEHSKEVIIDRFNKNYPGGYVKKPVIFNILSHPHWHFMDGPKLDAIFTHIKTYNYSSDTGPVVYTTMDEAMNIWESPQ